MSHLIWVHPDCLHPASPAFRKYPDAPSIFVFDDEELARAAWTLKRIGFIYECLMELPVVIRRGDPIIEVARYARETGATAIATVATPDTRITTQSRAVKAEILPEGPFVDLKGPIDLARFSRYWRKAERGLLPRR